MAVVITVTVLIGCQKRGYVATPEATTESVTEAATLPERMSPESGTVIYSAYADYRDLYNFEPLFNDSDWMDKDGRLLFPYRNITSKGFKIGDIFCHVLHVRRSGLKSDIGRSTCGCNGRSTDIHDSNGQFAFRNGADVFQ